MASTIYKPLILILVFFGALCASAQALSSGDYTFSSFFHKKNKCKKTFLNNDCSAKDALSATALPFTIEVEKKTGLLAIKGSCGKYLVGFCGFTAGFTSNKADYGWQAIPDKKFEDLYRFQLANASRCSRSFLQANSPKSACDTASLVLDILGDGALRFKLQKKERDVKPPPTKPPPTDSAETPPKPTTPTCTNTQYLDSATKNCKACKTSCGAGNFIKTPCSKTANVVCSACRTSCGTGNFIKTACSNNANAVCADCTAQCAVQGEAADVSACTGTTTTNGAVCRGLELVFDTTQGSGLDVALPLYGTVNVNIDWGDGSAVEPVTTAGETTHTYTSLDTYTVKVTGSLTQFGNGISGFTNIDKLVSVLSFGNLGITSFAYAFNSAINLESVPATLPPGVTNLSGMFGSAMKFNGDISKWDVSNVTSMRGMFRLADSFNGDISKWNVSKVTDMSRMFQFAFNFNSDISKWNVSQVTDMSNMFEDADSFKGDISEWNVSNVTYMTFMFSSANSFNSDISKWNVSKVTDMWGIFFRTSSFNSDISKWNVSKVTDMRDMFGFALKFNRSIKGWVLTDLTTCWNAISGSQNLECTNIPQKFFQLSCVQGRCPS